VSSWERVFRDFPANRNLIWLNNCGTTPTPGPVLSDLIRFHEDYAACGLWAPGWSYAAVQVSIKQRLARLFGAHPDEFALIPHTAEGMNFVSHGLRLAPGQSLLLLADEYPSNVYPWEHWRRKGVTLEFLPLGRTPEEFLSGFADRVRRGNVGAVSLSAVHWCTGMPLPLAEAGRICRERDIPLVVDGSQGAGLTTLRPQEMGMACMAFSAWKWLLGPLGLGVLYVARAWLDRIEPIFKGSESVVNDGQYFPYRDTLKPDASRFAISTGSLANLVHFDASLRYLEAIGWPVVQARLTELGAQLWERLRSAGFEPAWEGTGSNAIVSVRHPRLDSAEAVGKLRRENVVAAERLGFIRLAPHIYNNEEQLQRAASLLEAWR
jgi:selenocysteine lyase/cysteine desulfurase